MRKAVDEPLWEELDRKHEGYIKIQGWHVHDDEEVDESDLK